MLDWMLARVNLKADGVLRDIEETISAKIKALEQRRKELRSTVELIRINRKTILEMQKKKLEASRDTLRVSCHFVKRVLEDGNTETRFTIFPKGTQAYIEVPFNVCLW